MPEVVNGYPVTPKYYQYVKEDNKEYESLSEDACLIMNFMYQTIMQFTPGGLTSVLEQMAEFGMPLTKEILFAHQKQSGMTMDFTKSNVINLVKWGIVQPRYLKMVLAFIPFMPDDQPENTSPTKSPIEPKVPKGI